MDHDPTGDLDWTKISELVSLSESRLRHLFTAQTGNSPCKYSVKLRLSRAKTLLADDRLSISQIGLRLGWQERSHFERCFKDHYGLTPAKYRNLARKRLLLEKLSELNHSGHEIAIQDEE